LSRLAPLIRLGRRLVGRVGIAAIFGRVLRFRRGSSGGTSWGPWRTWSTTTSSSSSSTIIASTTTATITGSAASAARSALELGGRLSTFASAILRLVDVQTPSAHFDSVELLDARLRLFLAREGYESETTGSS